MTTLTNNPTLGMYVAAAVAITVVLGLLIYLWVIDKRVQEIKRAMQQTPLPEGRVTDELLRPQRITDEPSDSIDVRATSNKSI
ncbi:MAG: hypothetical protein NVS4B8_22480 [Herpetosiphon sp.]